MCDDPNIRDMIAEAKDRGLLPDKLHYDSNFLVTDMPLSSRARNCLTRRYMRINNERDPINTAGQLLKLLTTGTLIAWLKTSRNCGKKTTDEIARFASRIVLRKEQVGWSPDLPSEPGWFRVLINPTCPEIVHMTGGPIWRMGFDAPLDLSLDLVLWDHRPIKFLPVPEDEPS